jgi:hypothetical protein
MDDICVESSLDLSWIDEEEMLLQYQSFLLPSPLETIQVCCVFLDSSNQVMKVDRFTQSLVVDVDKSVSYLSVENIGDILSRCGVGVGVEDGAVDSFVVDDILLYNVDITTEQLQGYYDLVGSAGKFLKSVSGLGMGMGMSMGVSGSVARIPSSAIVVNSSLVIFHCIQTIYFFIRQVVRPKLVKSILKKDLGGGRAASTKRVRIHPATFKSHKGHKTRRMRDS